MLIKVELPWLRCIWEYVHSICRVWKPQEEQTVKNEALRDTYIWVSKIKKNQWEKVWKWTVSVIEGKPEISTEGSFEKKAFDLAKTFRIEI